MTVLPAADYNRQPHFPVLQTAMALLTIVLLILLNSVLAMSEIAVIASRRARLRESVRAGDSRAVGFRWHVEASTTWSDWCNRRIC